MTEILLWAAAWYCIGAAIIFRLFWELSPHFTVKDLIVLAIASVFGPLAAIWYFFYSNADWLNRRIF
jgi:hypothetical protein